MAEYTDRIGGGYCLICDDFVLWFHQEEKDILTDYKFFCFNGKPELMYISKDKGREARTDFFDMEFNHLDISMRDKNSIELPQKPKCFNEMIDLSLKLSKGFCHLRVDFFVVDNSVYVGELTFYHCSGFAQIKPPEWNYRMGKWMDISMH